MAESSVRRGVRPTLAAWAALLVLALSLGGVLVLVLAQGQVLEQAARDMLAARAARLAQGGVAFLDRAETLARTAAESVDQRIMGTDFGAGSGDSEAYSLLKAQWRSLYRLMGQQPLVLRAALADVRGDYWEVRGLADGTMRVRSIVRVADPHRCPGANAPHGGDRDGTCVLAALMKGDANGTILGSEPLPGETYDPRQESWHLAAVAAKAPAWAAPVAEPATGRASLLLAAPVVDARGRPLGTLSLVLDLEELSRLAQDLTPADQGSTFLARPDGALVAWSGQGGPVLAGPQGNGTALASPGQAGCPAGAKVLALAAAGSPGQARTLGVDLDGVAWLAAFQPLSEHPGRPALWAVAVAPAAELVPGPLARPGVASALALAVLGAVAALVLGWLASRRLAALAGDLDRLGDLDLESVPLRRSVLRELDGLASSLVRARDRLADYRRFLPVPLVRTLVRSGAVDAGPGELAEAPATLLLARLDAAAAQAGGFLPADLLEAVGEAAREVQGFAYAAGDGCLRVLWNAPVPAPDHPYLACQAVLGLLRALDTARSTEGNVPLPLHLGIHSGALRIGVGGANNLLSFGPGAPAEAVAESLADVAQACCVGCVLSRQARELVKDRVVTRVLDLVRLPGADRLAPVYELVAAPGQAPKRTLEFIRLYETGLSRLVKGECKEAARLLLAAHKLRPRPEDASCTLLLKRCIANGKRP